MFALFTVVDVVQVLRSMFLSRASVYSIDCLGSYK